MAAEVFLPFSHDAHAMTPQCIVTLYIDIWGLVDDIFTWIFFQATHSPMQAPSIIEPVISSFLAVDDEISWLENCIQKKINKRNLLCIRGILFIFGHWHPGHCMFALIIPKYIPAGKILMFVLYTGHIIPCKPDHSLIFISIRLYIWAVPWHV